VIGETEAFLNQGVDVDKPVFTPRLDRGLAKPAIKLSRKNWRFYAIGAVLHPIPGDRRASGSCPAGSMAEVGLRWWRRRTPLNRRGDPDVNAKVKASDPSTAK
jgi:hypothetical protein